MGLLDLFSKDKRDERARARNVERAVNKHAQSVDRMKALEALANDGSTDALYGLLRRFGMHYHKSIEDEQEKEWAFDALVAKGNSGLPAVRRYLISADSISWPLRLLAKIADKNEELAALEEVLARHEPGYERDPTKKIQLLNHLGAFKHEKAAPLVVPYLKDMDEGVRFAAVEALIRQKREEIAREPLLELFVDDAEESLRIRLRICDGFAELGWLVHGHRGGVEKKLPDAFQLDREGHIKKKPSAQTG
jgi:HEAT repeat protein